MPMPMPLPGPIFKAAIATYFLPLLRHCLLEEQLKILGHHLHLKPYMKAYALYAKHV